MGVDEIRNDFPALKEWTYLDTAFVGLYPRQVREGYDNFLDKWMLFDVSEADTILSEWLEKTEKVRSMVANMIGALASELAFTMCTGSGLNIIVNGTSWSKGDNVVFPEFEHNPLDTSTIRRFGVETRCVEAKEGVVELSDLERAVDDNTKLVQVSQVSYVNGFRFNLKEVADIAHEHGAKVLVDATQAIGALRTDVTKEDLDYVSAAPYKFLMGPAGLAFLYVRSDNLAELTPDRVGWKNQIFEGEHAEKPLDISESAKKFEYGTLHFQGIYGLEKSIQYLKKIGMNNVEKKVLKLSNILWNRLKDLGIKLYTPPDTDSQIISFYNSKASTVSAQLRAKKVKVTGREAHGGHIRASLHFYNNVEDTEYFIDKLSELISD